MCNGNHKATFYFHLAEGVLSTMEESKIILEKEEQQLTLSFKANCSCDIKILDNTISHSYGILKNAKTIALFLDFTDSFDLDTCLRF